MLRDLDIKQVNMYSRVVYIKPIARTQGVRTLKTAVFMPTRQSWISSDPKMLFPVQSSGEPVALRLSDAI